MKQSIRIKNKRASWQYILSDRVVAGIVLTGTEIKSIRSGKASLGEAFCTFDSDGMVLKSMHIAEYENGSYSNHEPKRERRLLLTKRELKKMRIKVTEKGFTIIPTTLFINDRGLAKVEIALAQGKHHYDKRETLKSNDAKRDIDRSQRDY